MPFDQTGVLASVTSPLASARIGVFAAAMHDTDYVLIPSHQEQSAIPAREAAGPAVTSGW
ncbi:MAG: ACT domain-containing protein [Casimicrobiaceae bacterium]